MTIASSTATTTATTTAISTGGVISSTTHVVQWNRWFMICVCLSTVPEAFFKSWELCKWITSRASKIKLISRCLSLKISKEQGFIGTFHWTNNRVQVEDNAKCLTDRCHVGALGRAALRTVQRGVCPYLLIVLSEPSEFPKVFSWRTRVWRNNLRTLRRSVGL